MENGGNEHEGGGGGLFLFADAVMTNFKKRNSSILDQVKKQASEMEALLQETRAQLDDVKIKLADKQAEAMTSNQQVEKLQEDLIANEG
nr:protein microtubule binding protein 2C [Tanacetum cinerariifolium]